MKEGMGSGTAGPDGPYSPNRDLIRRGWAPLEGKGGREGVPELSSTSERRGGSEVEGVQGKDQKVNDV